MNESLDQAAYTLTHEIPFVVAGAIAKAQAAGATKEQLAAIVDIGVYALTHTASALILALADSQEGETR